MDPIKLFTAVSLILLPAVMFGGYSLLHLQVRGNVLTPFHETYFRAGHAHAGTLLVLSLLFYQFLAHTSSSALTRWIVCSAVLVGLLAIAGGFFLHMARGESGRRSAAVVVVNAGAAVLGVATLVLAYLIFVT